MSVVVYDTETRKFLGRGRGWGRGWTDHLQEAAVWTTRGPGMNAAKQTFPYRERQQLEEGRFQYIEVRLEAVA